MLAKKAENDKVESTPEAKLIYNNRMNFSTICIFKERKLFKTIRKILQSFRSAVEKNRVSEQEAHRLVYGLIEIVASLHQFPIRAKGSFINDTFNLLSIVEGHLRIKRKNRFVLICTSESLQSSKLTIMKSYLEQHAEQLFQLETIAFEDEYSYRISAGPFSPMFVSKEDTSKFTSEEIAFCEKDERNVDEAIKIDADRQLIYTQTGKCPSFAIKAAIKLMFPKRMTIIHSKLGTCEIIEFEVL